LVQTGARVKMKEEWESGRGLARSIGPDGNFITRWTARCTAGPAAQHERFSRAASMSAVEHSAHRPLLMDPVRSGGGGGQHSVGACGNGQEAGHVLELALPRHLVGGPGSRRQPGLGLSIGREGNFLSWSPLAALSRSPSLRYIDRAGDLRWTERSSLATADAIARCPRPTWSCTEPAQISVSPAVSPSSCVKTGESALTPSIGGDGNFLPWYGPIVMGKNSPATRAIDCAGNFVGWSQTRWVGRKAGGYGARPSSEGSASNSESISSAATTEHCEGPEEELHRGPSVSTPIQVASCSFPAEGHAHQSRPMLISADFGADDIASSHPESEDHLQPHGNINALTRRAKVETVALNSHKVELLSCSAWAQMEHKGYASSPSGGQASGSPLATSGAHC
jgi:hypothetical protein